MSMLDCPEQSHTSPIAMSSSAAAVVPSARSTSVCPAPGSVCGGKTTRQRPSGPAAARSVRASSATSTSAPGAAVPQTGSGQSRWRTAREVKGAANAAGSSAPSKTMSPNALSLRKGRSGDPVQ